MKTATQAKQGGKLPMQSSSALAQQRLDEARRKMIAAKVPALSALVDKLGNWDAPEHSGKVR